MKGKRILSNRRNISNGDFQKKGKIPFGYDITGQKIPGYIEISLAEIKNAGLTPEYLEFEEFEKIAEKKFSILNIVKGGILRIGTHNANEAKKQEEPTSERKER